MKRWGEEKYSQSRWGWLEDVDRDKPVPSTSLDDMTEPLLGRLRSAALLIGTGTGTGRV